MSAVVRWSALASIVLGANSALAQPEKTPEQLFNEAKQDVDARRFDEACPKFEASYRVSQKPGALLSWADCEEKRDRLATALRLWEDGGARVKDDAERTAFVTSRLESLRPRVPRIAISIGLANARALSVTVDTRSVDVFSGPIPVDPGEHVVAASAEGTATETRAVKVAIGETVAVTVLSPKAEPEKPAPDATKPRAPAAAEPGDDSLKIAGWVVGAVGLGGALAFGGTAISVSLTCTEDGVDSNGNDLDGHGCPSGSQGLLIGNAVTLGVGIAGLGVGVGLLIAGYTKTNDSAAPALTAGPGDIGFGLSWRLGGR